MTLVSERPTPCIAVDGGASGCRLAAFDAAGDRLGTVRLDRHASLSLGPAEAARHVLEGLGRLRAATGIGPSAEVPLAFGLAGALRPDRCTSFREALPATLAVTALVTDGRAQLLGATGGGPGACLSIGTGSVLHWDAAGAVGMAGGWGFPVGDAGSAAWLGAALLRRYLRERDRGRSAGEPLFADLEAVTGADVASLQEWTTCSVSTRVGSLATLVTAHAERDHPIALALLEEGVEHCLELFDAAPAGLPRYLVGGLAPVYAPRLERRGVALWAPRGDALDGLARLARAGAGDGAAAGALAVAGAAR